MENKLPYLNLGCGGRFHKQWVNIDFVNNGEDVIGHNLLKGIPFDDNTFEAVYHSHVLEHFSKAEAKQFIAGCYRVLKPGGILRIAVPDLETIINNYIKLIELGKADEFNENIRADYDWTMIELYDQSVRNTGGGEMLAYLSKAELLNETFVVERLGHEAKMIRQSALQGEPNVPAKRSAFRKFFSGVKKSLSPRNFKRALFSVLFKKEYQLIQLAEFRSSGEIHQWMYDFYSLSYLLKQAGFKKVERKTYNTSDIPGWANFQLDEVEGEIRKPDSIFVEAIK